jgi:hypothetical protein
MMAGEDRRYRQGHLRLALLDEPWQRFPLVVLVATLFWCLMLAGLGLLLQPDRANVPHPEPVEAEIIEVPANGLAGGRRWFSGCQPKLFNAHEVHPSSGSKAFASEATHGAGRCNSTAPSGADRGARAENDRDPYSGRSS